MTEDDDVGLYVDTSDEGVEVVSISEAGTHIHTLDGEEAAEFARDLLLAIRLHEAGVGSGGWGEA